MAEEASDWGPDSASDSGTATDAAVATVAGTAVSRPDESAAGRDAASGTGQAFGAGPADPEIVQGLSTVTPAAQQPTANWIGNALRLMLTDDRFAVTLSGGRGSAGQALNEVLWEDTPTQNFIGRWATRAVANRNSAASEIPYKGEGVRVEAVTLLTGAAAHTSIALPSRSAARCARNEP